MKVEFASASDRADRLAEMIRPPRRVPVSQSASEIVRITAVGGYNGLWNPDVAPYMVEPMNCLSSREYESVIFAGPARTGKTQGLVDCWIGHAVTMDPGDMMLVFPTEILADDYSKRRMRRLHSSSPQLRSYLSSRSHDNTVRTTTYRHGMMLNLAWPTSSQLAQRDLRYVGMSDYDSMPDDISGEGEPFQLGRKRTETFGSAGCTLVESSPKRDRIDPKWRPKSPHEAPPTRGGVLSLYNRGDQRRWYWSCLHCNDRFEAPPLPTYEDLGDPEKSALTACVPCPHCGAVHTQEDKRALNIGGQWQGDPDKSSNIASFWMLGCAAAFQTWDALVVNYLQALRDYERTGEETALITTSNVDQGVPYLRQSAKSMRTADELIERAEDWTRGKVPEGVRYLLAVADVQKNRFVVQVIGYGVGGESWLVDRFELLWSTRTTVSGEREPLDPAGYLEDWNRLTEVIDRRYLLMGDESRYMSIYALACDSGGKEGVTERAYDWWRKMRNKGHSRRVRLVKGEAGNRKAARVRETRPDSTRRKDRKGGGRGDVPLLVLNTNELKDSVNADLSRTEHGAGFVHLPAWIDDRVFEELTAEIRGAKGWERPNTGTPNEAWDLYVYGKALGLFFGADRIDWNNPPRWANDWGVNPWVNPVDVATDTMPKAHPEPVKRSRLQHKTPLRPRSKR